MHPTEARDDLQLVSVQVPHGGDVIGFVTQRELPPVLLHLKAMLRIRGQQKIDCDLCARPQVPHLVRAARRDEHRVTQSLCEGVRLDARLLKQELEVLR